MYTVEQRAVIRSRILENAAKDQGIAAAAITGSGALGNEDRWSDIDLAFALADGVPLASALSDWTAYMYSEHAAIHHVDVPSGAWLYRVFLLPETLQVDLAFAPAAEFRALAPTFKLVFGSANEPSSFPSPSQATLIGLGWLYALHARTSLARGRLWQAEYMISGVRNHALALACVRHGLPAVHGRGTDRLPAEITARFERSFVQRIDARELATAFQIVADGFLSEVSFADEALAVRLHDTVVLLKQSLSDEKA